MCYDPIAAAERREEIADKILKSLPHCVICGSAIFPGAKYREAFRKPVCEYCFDELETNVEFVEE